MSKNMKKKLLLVIPLPPPVNGSNLMSQYVADCRDLYAYYTVKVLPLHYASSIADLGSIRIKKLFKLGKYLIKLFSHLIHFQPDIVYFVPAVTGMPFYRDCLFALLLKCFGSRVVYHLHGKGIKYRLDSRNLLMLYRWFFRNAYIIYLSPFLYDDIKAAVFLGQCWNLPNGIEDPGLNFVRRSSTSHEFPVILFLSNLNLSKGPLTLLEACRILHNKGLEFRASFVGSPTADNDSKAFSEIIRKLGLRNCVEVIGPKYGNEKYDILINANVLAFPTFYKNEAFPLVLLEAMSVGLPVISTQEGAIPEIIDDGITGFVVDKKNPTMLAERLEWIILNPELAEKMGQAGRDKFERCYTIERFYEKLTGIFKEVLGRIS